MDEILIRAESAMPIFLYEGKSVIAVYSAEDTDFTRTWARQMLAIIHETIGEETPVFVIIDYLTTRVYAIELSYLDGPDLHKPRLLH